MTNPLDPLPDSSAAGRSPLDLQLEALANKRKQGDVEAALEGIERIVRAHPKNVGALNEKGICLRLLDQSLKATLVLRQARKYAPESPEILANLAGSLRDQAQHEDAIRAYRKALELRPDFAPVLAELGETYHAIDMPKKAIAAYEKSLALHPLNAVTFANLASALGEVGESARSLEAADRSLNLDPHERRAMVVKSIALHELDRHDEATELLDLEWARAFPFEEVEGFESLGTFNSALAEHVINHPTLEYEPVNRSTIQGEQTGELLVEPKGAMAQLGRMIEDCVKAYLQALPQRSDHPYLSIRPSRFRWNVWGTCLGTAGHQSPHIHPGGWVSGVYYVQLPPEVSASAEDQSGWIRFGGTPDSWQKSGEHPLRLIQPSEGSLVLFPSYFYHRTLPFKSETKRISIAFDAIPL